MLDIPPPPSLIERYHREGVFGVIGWIQYRAGKRTQTLLGIAHPAADWIEWIKN